MRTAFTDLVGVPHPIVGFNRSPGVVAAVTNAGGFGVLGASAYTPAELDAQLTWIDEQTEGKPYGVDLLVPEKFAAGDPANLVASLRAQIPDGHLAFVSDLLDRYGIPDVPGNPEHDEIAATGAVAEGRGSRLTAWACHGNAAGALHDMKGCQEETIRPHEERRSLALLRSRGNLGPGSRRGRWPPRRRA